MKKWLVTVLVVILAFVPTIPDIGSEEYIFHGSQLLSK